MVLLDVQCFLDHTRDILDVFNVIGHRQRGEEA